MSWRVDTKEQLDRLVKYGARGATIFRWPEEIIQWLSAQSTTK